MHKLVAFFFLLINALTVDVRWWRELCGWQQVPVQPCDTRPCVWKGMCVHVYGSYNFYFFSMITYNCFCVLAVSIHNCTCLHRNHCICSMSVLWIVICLAKRMILLVFASKSCMCKGPKQSALGQKEIQPLFMSGWAQKRNDCCDHIACYVIRH